MTTTPRTEAALCRLPNGSIMDLIGYGDIVRAEFARTLERESAKKDDEIMQLRAEIGAIEAGLGKEYGPGDKRSGDLIDDFTEFLAHHKATELKLAAALANKP